MILLELANDLGLEIKKASNSRGGEYHSRCPGCGEGRDRFIIWPEQDKYWCRRCGKRGDAIQFCREFMKMSFHEACRKLKFTPCKINPLNYNKRSFETLPIASEPPDTWQKKALAFVQWSQKRLMRSSTILESIYQRGFENNTISQFKLGYCINDACSYHQDFYRERADWGLTCEYKTDGKAKKLWLPVGLVIPTISPDGRILKLKVRRQNWQKDDLLPKYVEISGSMHAPSIYGDIQKEVAIVLESELDAMLIQQVAKDLCFSVSLGGATKKPDFYTDHLLRKTKLILWCLDNDEAGTNAALWWYENYLQLQFWPAPVGKSPGDALKDHGLNLRDWILKGITHTGESIYKDKKKEV